MRRTKPGSFPWLGALVLGVVSGLAQTQVDLQTQSKRVDFSTAAYTKPMKTGAALPASCSVGEFFFNTSAPAGSNVHACVAANTWARQEAVSSLGGDVSGPPATVTVRAIQGRPVSATAPAAGQALVWNGSRWEGQALAAGGGTGQPVQVQADGMVVGSRGAINFVAGFGLLTAITDTGARVDVQHNVDSAVMETRANQQSGSTLLCASGGGSGLNYSCTLKPALTAYTAGMVLRWRPDVTAAGGAITLNVDLLGARPVKLADGATDPTAADAAAGRLYNLWYDGAVFRLMSAPGIGDSAPASRPACNATRRSRLWVTFGVAGVKDEVAVCAKAADDSYAWRTLY